MKNFIKQEGLLIAEFDSIVNDVRQGNSAHPHIERINAALSVIDGKLNGDYNKKNTEPNTALLLCKATLLVFLISDNQDTTKNNKERSATIDKLEDVNAIDSFSEEVKSLYQAVIATKIDSQGALSAFLLEAEDENLSKTFKQEGKYAKKTMSAFGLLFDGVKINRNIHFKKKESEKNVLDVTRDNFRKEIVGRFKEIAGRTMKLTNQKRAILKQSILSTSLSNRENVIRVNRRVWYFLVIFLILQAYLSTTFYGEIAIWSLDSWLIFMGIILNVLFVAKTAQHSQLLSTGEFRLTDFFTLRFWMCKFPISPSIA